MLHTNQISVFVLGALVCLDSAPSRAADLLTEPALLNTSHPWVEDAALSPAGTQVVVVSRPGDRAQVTLWDTTTGEVLRMLAEGPIDREGVGGLMQTVFSPTGERVLVDGYLDDTPCSIGVHLWAVHVSEDGGMQLIADPCVGEHVIGWTWSPDGDRIATLADETPQEEGTPYRLRIWDAMTGEMQLTFLVPGVPWPHQPVWLHNGDEIATPSSEGRIWLWNPTTGGSSRVFEGPFEGLYEPKVAVSPDGKAAADIVPRDQPYEGHLRIWDLVKGTSQLVDYLHLQPSVDSSVKEMRFSRDGRFLVAEVSTPGASQTRIEDVVLFDASTGRLLAKLAGAGELPSQSSFSEDARQVLTLSSEGAAIWDLSDVLAKPHINIGEAGPEIRWYLGTLQFAPTINGPWSDLPATSPFPLSPIGEMGFFRVKVAE